MKHKAALALAVTLVLVIWLCSCSSVGEARERTAKQAYSDFDEYVAALDTYLKTTGLEYSIEEKEYEEIDTDYFCKTLIYTVDGAKLTLRLDYQTGNETFCFQCYSILPETGGTGIPLEAYTVMHNIVSGKNYSISELQFFMAEAYTSKAYAETREDNNLKAYNYACSDFACTWTTYYEVTAANEESLEICGRTKAGTKEKRGN